MVVFLAIILGSMLGLDIYWWYQADHLLRPLRHAKRWRIALGIFMGVMIATLLTRMLKPAASRTINSDIPMAIVSAQYLWHLMVLPVSCLALILYRSGRGIGRLFTRPQPTESATALPSRRNVLKAAAVAVPPLITAGGVVGSLNELGNFRVRRFDLRLPGLPKALDGMTIAHLSDFHVGRFMTPEMMRPVIDQTNEMKPDLVLITGDLIDYALVDLPPALKELSRLRPPGGIEGSVAMCIGNHDVIEDERTFINGVREAGIPLLVNETRTVHVRDHAIQLFGIDWAKRSRTVSADRNTAGLVRGAASVRDPNAFPILLAHHPHAYDEAVRQRFPLTLSGHTHGGQLMATEKFGAGSIMFRYWSGLYTKALNQQPNGSQMIVSNGIGNWFPLRINAPAELIQLTLHPET